MVLQQGADALGRGDNVYTQQWTNSPGVQDFFPYLPWMAVLTAPGRWIAGDVRWAVLFWSLVLFAGLWALARGRVERAAAVTAVLVLAPGTLTQVDQAWTEPVLAALIVWWAVLVRRGHAWWAVLPLALACASKQHLALLAPVLLLWRPFGAWRTLATGALAALLMLPWVVADAGAFLGDTVTTLLTFHPIKFANTWYLYALNEHGVTLPFWVTGATMVGVVAVAAYAVWRRRPGTDELLRWLALVLAVANLVNKQAFYNQFWLVGALVAASLALPQGEPAPTARPTADVGPERPAGRGQSGFDARWPSRVSQASVSSARRRAEHPLEGTVGGCLGIGVGAGRRARRHQTAQRRLTVVVRDQLDRLPRGEVGHLEVARRRAQVRLARQRARAVAGAQRGHQRGEEPLRRDVGAGVAHVVGVALGEPPRRPPRHGGPHGHVGELVGEHDVAAARGEPVVGRGVEHDPVAGRGPSPARWAPRWWRPPVRPPSPTRGRAARRPPRRSPGASTSTRSGVPGHCSRSAGKGPVDHGHVLGEPAGRRGARDDGVLAAPHPQRGHRHPRRGGAGAHGPLGLDLPAGARAHQVVAEARHAVAAVEVVDPVAHVDLGAGPQRPAAGGGAWSGRRRRGRRPAHRPRPGRPAAPGPPRTSRAGAAPRRTQASATVAAYDGRSPDTTAAARRRSTSVTAAVSAGGGCAPPVAADADVDGPTTTPTPSPLAGRRRRRCTR